MTKTLIRFTLRNRKTGELAPAYVSAVKFADGPGYRVKSVTKTRDRAKALPFSTVAAFEIAAQFYTERYLSLELIDGTPLAEENKKLDAERTARFDKRNAAIRAENEAFRPVVEELGRIFERDNHPLARKVRRILERR